jgi:hypothetical protein
MPVLDHVAELVSILLARNFQTVRFGLELVRGDRARPHLLGFNRAQWTAQLTAVAGTIAGCSARWQSCVYRLD